MVGPSAVQVTTLYKSDWPVSRAVDRDAPFGPNGAAVEACLERARAFSRSELVRLDLQERRDPDLLLAAWDHIRDRLDHDPEHARRLAARDAAWAAVGDAAARHEIVIPSGDAYWRVALGPGAGAARVTRYVACALVDPAALDPEWLALVLDPWRAVIGDVPGVHEPA
jgi:hypothetical protein